MGPFDIYKGVWHFLFGVDSASAPTTQNPLVVNSDGSINVANQTSGGQKTQIVDPAGNVIGSPLSPGTFLDTIAYGVHGIGTGTSLTWFEGASGWNILNVAGAGQGQTGANPSGTIYAGHTDITSIGGAGLSPISAVHPAIPVNIADTVGSAVIGNNSSSGVVTGSVIPTGSFIYGWNGTTWDQLKSTAGILNAVSTSQYPVGAIPVVAAGTGTTAAVAVTLPGTSGKTTYICGFTITAAATSLATGAATVANLVGSTTFTYDQTVAAVANGTSKLTEVFDPGIPASATNTGIVVTSAAAGLGGVTDVNVWGYQL